MPTFSTHYSRDYWGCGAKQLYEGAAKETRSAGMGNAVLEEYQRFLWVNDDHGTPIGIVAYTYEPLDDQVWIELAYVAPEHRRQGIYSALRSELRRRAINLGAKTIASGIHKTNVPMLAAASKEGCELAPFEGEAFMRAVEEL